MDECQSVDEDKPILNFYKIIFPKNAKYPVGYYSRNLTTKIRDKKNQIYNYEEKNEDYFHPISDNNTLKIQQLYSKFQTIRSATKYNRSFNKKKEFCFSRPLSQHTTYIGFSKNYSCPFINNTSKTRPMSQLNKNSTMFIDNFTNNNFSKITKNSNQMNINFIKEKPKLLNRKNNNNDRSCSALLIKRKKDLFNYPTNPEIKELLKQEEQIKKKKKELKARLLTALSKDLVLNKGSFNYYNKVFKDEDVKKVDDIIPKKKDKKKIFYYIKHHPDIFSKSKPPFRYEDYYYSPLEFLTKYFSKEELILLKSSPEYFGLDRLPFKNSDFEFNPTLLSKLEYEENSGDENKLIIKEKKNISCKKNKFDLNKELNKIKKIFQKRKINKVKRKPIKGKDFVSHYERDIEPDEGTVQYFERKYIKYLNNKEKRMEKKINNIKYRKSQFEFLKNERTQKLEEEKNVQRITNPIINIIKKNYIRANNINV